MATELTLNNNSALTQKHRDAIVEAMCKKGVTSARFWELMEMLDAIDFPDDPTEPRASSSTTDFINNNSIDLNNNNYPYLKDREVFQA